MYMYDVMYTSCLLSSLYIGTFHLIHTLIEDYIVHTLESLMEAEKENEFTQRIQMLQLGTYYFGKDHFVKKCILHVP